MGVMGLNLSRNFANQGISLALYNRFVKGSEEQVALKKIKAYPELNSALPFESLDSFHHLISFYTNKDNIINVI